jgi:hypothetical protein
MKVLAYSMMGLGLLASPQGVRKTATKLGAKRVLKEFGEEVADPLYHNTGIENVIDILKSGSLKGERRSKDFDVDFSHISLTRNPQMRTWTGKKEPTPAQIIVNKEDIKNLGKISPHQFGGKTIFAKKSAQEPSLKELKEVYGEAEELFFTPQQRHLAREKDPKKFGAKGVERARTPKRVPKIPTEKFEGIHIENFDTITAGFGGGQDTETLTYFITELMKNAHKRKVPIILGPEATETFYKLGMDKKLPKTWQGRLVTDRTVSVGRTQLTEPTKKAVGATPRDLRQKLEILDRSQNLGINKKTGKRFWGIVVDPLDGKIEYTIPYSKAYTSEFIHHEYMPGHLSEQIEEGSKILMYFHKGLESSSASSYLTRLRYIPPRTNRSAAYYYKSIGKQLIPWEAHGAVQMDQKLYDKIYEQIEILPSSKPKLPGP